VLKILIFLLNRLNPSPSGGVSVPNFVFLKEILQSRIKLSNELKFRSSNYCHLRCHWRRKLQWRVLLQTRPLNVLCVPRSSSGRCRTVGNICTGIAAVMCNE